KPFDFTFGKSETLGRVLEERTAHMYTQCTYKCALSRLRECMLLSYHFYFFNLDNAFLKFCLIDLCMMDRKFIFFNCGNCSYWLLEVANYFLYKSRSSLLAVGYPVIF